MEFGLWNRAQWMTIVAVAAILGSACGFNPPPRHDVHPITIVSITPAEVPAGSAPFEVKVEGGNFDPSQSEVYWNSLRLESHSCGEHCVAAMVVAYRIAVPGTVTITVRQGNKESNPLEFKIRKSKG